MAEQQPSMSISPRKQKQHDRTESVNISTGPTFPSRHSSSSSCPASFHEHPPQPLRPHQPQSSSVSSANVLLSTFSDTTPALRTVTVGKGPARGDKDDDKKFTCSPTLAAVPRLGSKDKSTSPPLSPRLATPTWLASNGYKSLVLFAFTLLFLWYHPPFPSHAATSAVHPVSNLISQARKSLEANRAIAPRNLREAHERYVATHGRLPPNGYDQWFYFADGIRACGLTTGYKSLYNSLAVWWALQPAEINNRMDALARSSAPALGRVQIRGKKVVPWRQMVHLGVAPGSESQRNATQRLYIEEIFNELLHLHQLQLPDIDIFVNGLEEPRVVIPFELNAELTSKTKRGQLREPVEEEIKFHSLGHGLAFDVARRACPAQSLARAAPLSLEPGTSPHVHHRNTAKFTSPTGYFVTDHILERQSWCDQPDLQEIYSTFIKPENFVWTDQLLPVFSSSKLPGFNDILVPSYASTPFEPLAQTAGVTEWIWKLNRIFWRGNVTKATAPDLTWLGLLDSRLVSRTNRPISWAHFDQVVIADENSHVITATLPSALLNNALTDIAYYTPDKDAAQLQEPSFRFEDPSTLRSVAHHFKAVVDLDSSPSMVATMAHASAVFASRFRMTVLDESLVPWYHYVPLSLRLSELYSLAAYFFSPRAALGATLQPGTRASIRELGRATRGVAHERSLKEIAENGRDWAETCGTRAEALAYVALLALEWGRLTSENRGSHGFVLGPGEGL